MEKFTLESIVTSEKPRWLCLPFAEGANYKHFADTFHTFCWWVLHIHTYNVLLIFRVSLLWQPCVEESIVKSSCFRQNTYRTEQCSTEKDRKVFRSSTSVHITATYQKSGKNVHIEIGWTLWWGWSELVLINTCDYVISRGNDLNDITGC